MKDFEKRKNQEINTNTDGKAKTFCLFIVLLRAIATCFISNTHFDPIYPNPNFAVGGLIGDVLFFAVSGFCLAEIEKRFFLKWYGRRLLRICPSVIFVSGFFCLIGVASFQINSFWAFVKIFIYPTRYHFVASILLLYIPFYFVMRINAFKRNIPWIMLFVFAFWILTYIFLFDKTQRLDTAQVHLTKFLFFEIMLFGAYVKLHFDKFQNINRWTNWFLLVVFMAFYLVSKVIIDKKRLNNLQFLIVIFLFGIGAFFLLSFCGMENRIAKSKIILPIAKFLALIPYALRAQQRGFALYGYG